MKQIQTQYYPNGQRHSEAEMEDGVVNGICRLWSESGILLEEMSFRNGTYDGMCRQWNSRGELLGEFTIVNGTGVVVRWNDDGSLLCETSVVNGKWTGRHRVWADRTSVIADEYYILDKKVSRKKYLEEAARHPDWPQYLKDKSRVNKWLKQCKRRSVAPTSDELKELESMLANSQSKEALAWLQSGPPGSHTIGENWGHARSVAIVRNLYAYGAVRVTAVEIDRYEPHFENTGKLVVTLPDATKARAELFRWCNERAKRGGFDAVKDVGQKHLFISLD